MWAEFLSAKTAMQDSWLNWNLKHLHAQWRRNYSRKIIFISLTVNEFEKWEESEIVSPQKPEFEIPEAAFVKLLIILVVSKVKQFYSQRSLQEAKMLNRPNKETIYVSLFICRVQHSTLRCRLSLFTFPTTSNLSMVDGFPIQSRG